MKKIYNLSHYMCICLGLVYSLCSCWPGGTFTDPYIIPESRQKENFYYLPSTPNTPLHSKKDDVSLSIVAASNSKYSGADIQASYMPGKHVGIMASYSFANDFAKYNRFELGAGFVTDLSANWHFETYAGFGKGKITNNHPTGTSNIDLTHFFLQPAVALCTENKNIQFAIVSKFSGVNFTVKDTSFKTDREPFSTRQIKSLYDQPFHIMWEPGFVFRAGWENFQFHTGYSFSTDLSNPDLHKANGNLSLGVTVRVNTQNKK